MREGHPRKIIAGNCYYNYENTGFEMTTMLRVLKMVDISS